VAECGGGGIVEEGGDRRILACLVELGALLRIHSRGRIEGEVTLRWELSGEVNVHEHAGTHTLTSGFIIVAIIKAG
jgi:hypothetical protein